MKDLFQHYKARAFLVLLPFDFGTRVAHVPLSAEFFSLKTRRNKKVRDFDEGEAGLGFYQVGLPEGDIFDAVYTCVEP